MRTITEPGSFFGESTAFSKNTFGITASTADDLSLHIYDHEGGKSVSIPLTQAGIEEFESLLGVCRAWLRSEQRSQSAEQA